MPAEVAAALVVAIPATVAAAAAWRNGRHLRTGNGSTIGRAVGRVETKLGFHVQDPNAHTTKET